MKTDSLSTDYELACGFECDLYLLQPDELPDIPISDSYPESYASPLVEFPISFNDTHKKLGLTCTAASILDSMRSLTLSITLLPPTANDSQAAIIQNRASQIHANLASLPNNYSSLSTSSENIYTVIYLTALAYTSCISSGRLFNDAYTPSERSNLHKHINLVPLKTWKKIPGIYLWILLVACPGLRFHAPLLLKSHVRATSLYISFTDFGLAVGCLKGFWRAIMWIKGLSKEGRG